MGMIQIDIDMPTDCASCWIRQNMGCKIANESGWLNNRRDDRCLLKEQEPVKVQYTAMGGLRYGACPQCDARIDNLVNPKACGFCGQAVKWE